MLVCKSPCLVERYRTIMIFLFLAHLSTKLIGLFLWRSSNKIAQIVLLRCTKWPPELKIEKNSNNISSLTTRGISTKLDRIVSWEVFYQTCSNCSTPLHKMAIRAKNRKYFKRHLLCNYWADFKHDRIVP